MIVVLDPGRRNGKEGRVLIARSPGAAVPDPAVSRPAACRMEAGLTVVPEALASALIRSLGLPQSAELPEPPAFCTWPLPPARLAGYGARAPNSEMPGDSRDYLENLRSLGYL
mgnify:FL=1